jgi:hypothetical protein
MGPNENPTNPAENQKAGRRRCLPCRPRMGHCLLKGCEERFHPRQARQRYCSVGCRETARKWSRWKAQQRYRATRAGKRQRNGQSQRYRKRVRSRKPAEPEAISDPARVITKNFFRGMLRPPRLLGKIPAAAAKSLAALLLAHVPAGAGARRSTGAALETGAHLIRRY